MDSFQPEDERWEQAVAGRLAMLRTMPVDTSGLAKALHAQIPQPARRAGTTWLSLRSIGALAASILIAGALASVFIFITMSRPALASPAQMARMHEELVAGMAPAIQVDSIDAANKVLAGEHPQAPTLPQVPAEHVMACCMKSVKNTRISCLLMKQEGVPVSLMVARSQDMRAPSSPVTVRDDVSYHVQASGGLNMVMTERHDRWVCLIGELPAERLIDVAAQLKF